VRRLLPVFVLLAALLSAQPVPNMPKPELLWPNGAPGALGTQDDDQPSLYPYLVPPGRGTGTAVIVCPGGSYRKVELDLEGNQVARWLNSIGVTAFVLNYRVGPRYHHPVELTDAQRAIRLVRFRAAQYGALPDRIGMMGLSAGGHLASTAGTHFEAGNPAAADPIDRMTSRPDFLVLAYPVISFEAPYVHRRSLEMLLGDKPDPKLVENLSNELQVTPQTPPAFLFHGGADRSVPVENSVLFYLALRKAGVPAELHIYERGPHGVGLATTDEALSSWTRLLTNWLRVRELLNAAPR
jgi:acetyl esterase/lipase